MTIATIGIAAVITAGAACMGIHTYCPVEKWSVNYTAGAPTDISNAYDTIIMDAYPGGYQTDCTSINGSNDRLIKVTANSYAVEITTDGRSSVIPYKKIDLIDDTHVAFHFSAYGSVCKASGTIGYYI